jgi:hypothetical protein
MGTSRRHNRIERFLDNIEHLFPREIASCFHVTFDSDGHVVIDENEDFGALVGGCILIAAVLDIVSSASKGLKWNEYNGEKHSKAMGNFIKHYLPSPYQAVNWYTQFRSPLVHNFCPKRLELTHHKRFRSRHLKEVQIKGEPRICVHIFQLLDDVTFALKNFAKDVRTDSDLYRRVKRYVGHHGVLEPRNPD